MRAYLLFLLIFSVSCQIKKKNKGPEDNNNQSNVEQNEEEEEEQQEEQHEEEEQAEVNEEEEKSSKAQLVLDPEFSLNFQPNANTPLYLPLVVTDIPAPVVELNIVATDPEGKALDDIFLAGSREVTKKENGLFDVAIAMPFLVNDKTMKGFNVDVTIENVKDKDGNILHKKSKFVISSTLYSLWHQEASSPLKDFAVVNEYLEPGFKGDLLSYIKMLLNSGGRSLGDHAAADMEKIRERLSLDSDDKGEFISLQGSAFFSFSFPGQVRIKTNGHQIGIAGSDWSQVSIEVGYKPEVRRKGSLSTPEIFVAVFSPPRLVNQENNDEPMPYPQARGSRGVAASAGAECDRILYEVASDIPNFRTSRATCRNEFRALSGQDQTLLLIKENTKARVPVVSEDPRDFGSLVKIEEDGRSIFQIGRDGERCQGNCVMVEHDPSRFIRSPNGYEPSEKLLQEVEASYDPNQKDIYPGEDKLMVMPVEENKALIKGEASFDKDRSVIYGAADLWEDPETIAWADGICARELDANFKAWEAPYGDVTELGELKGEGKTALFSNMVPGIHAIASVSATADGNGSHVEVKPDTRAHLEDSNSFYRASMSGVDYRLNGEAEQSLKALSPVIEVFGGPGGHGASSPYVIAHLPAEAGEYLYEGVEGLRGDSGPYGYSIRKELANGNFRIEVLSPGDDHHGYKLDCSSDDLSGDCVLKKADDGSYIVDYFSTDADFQKGHKVRLSYETKRLQGTYQADYEDFKSLKARFSVNKSFDMLMPSASRGYLAAGNGFAGGVRAGSNTDVLSRDYGFWNFKMAKKPVYFQYWGGYGRQLIKKAVNGAHSIGGTLSRGFKKVAVCPATGKHCWDADTNTDLCTYDFKGGDVVHIGDKTLQKPQRQQSMRFREAAGEVDCHDYVALDGLSIQGDWKVNTTVHYFANDRNFPDCMGGNYDYSKCSHRMRLSPDEEKNLDNDIEAYENNCVGRYLYKPYSDYKNSIEAACKSHQAYKIAKHRKWEGDALKKFGESCQNNCKNAIVAMNWLVKHYPIERLESIEEQLKLNRSTNEGNGESFLNESISNAEHRAIAKYYRTLTSNKDILLSVYDKYQPVWGDAMKHVTGSDFYFDSKESLNAAVPDYNMLLKSIIQLHRPKIKTLACKYDVEGIFRRFKKAKLESVSLIADKYFVAETSLEKDYHYQANQIRRKVIMPDLSDIKTQKVVLRRENTAKEGRLRLPARTVLSDCADLANRLINIGAPLPKDMFLNACS